MYHTKLLETLRTLNARERNRWQQYVEADFVNKHDGLRRLCAYILNLPADASDPGWQKKHAYEAVFGSDEAYQDLKFNNLVSDLYALLVRFLAYQKFETDQAAQMRYAASALLERNLGKQPEGALEQYRRWLDRRSDRSADWWQQQLHWWEAAEVLHSRQPRRSAGEHLRRQADALDKVFAFEKLRMGVAMRSRSALAVVQADERPRWLTEVCAWCRDDAFLRDDPAVQVYLAALDLVEQPAPETFQTLQQALERHYLLFTREEQLALHQLALNYCIRRINDGHASAYADALALYRTMLDRDLLLRQGRLSQWTYKNITAAGLRSGAFAWTEAFLYQYRDTLLPAERDNAFAYNLAELYFEKQDYTGTLRTLQNVEFTDFTYHLGAKTLQLKSFFALDELEALSALLDATRQLLRRNRSLSSFGKTTNLNFLHMLRLIKLWKQRQSLVSPRRWKLEQQDLQNQIQQLQPLAHRDWLLRCLD